MNEGAASGAKAGSAGASSAAQANIQRRAKLRQLLAETADAAGDPYLIRNSNGKYECKLCYTHHNNEGSYMAHTQGKNHQTNLARRAAMLAKKQNLEVGQSSVQELVEKKKIQPRKIARIGSPAYKIVKQKDPFTLQKSLLFQLSYPQIEEGMVPRYRFMSAFEQHVEQPNEKFQYILFGAEPYEIVAFKIPNVAIDQSQGKLFTHWDEDSKNFTLQLFFELSDKFEQDY